MKTPVKGTVLATMVATLFGCGGQAPSPSAPTTSATVKCVGINECRAHGDCGGIAGATCAGTNSCRGKGWIKAPADTCATKGGHPLGGEAAPAATTPHAAETGPKTSLPPAKTTMLAALQEIGIDLAKDTDLSALPLAKKRKVMQLFIKALDTNCDTCHEDGFKTDTRNKRIARRMWSDFVAVLREKDGTPVFCDSCHQGHVTILARDDDKVLAAYMKASYVDGMVRADEAAQKCATCHGDPFEPDIFRKRFKVD